MSTFNPFIALSVFDSQSTIPLTQEKLIQLQKSEKEKAKAKEEYWDNTSQKNLKLGYIRENKDRLNWYYVTRNKSDFNFAKVDIGFIREFKEYLDWDCVSRNWKLSEKFLDEFKDYLTWRIISARYRFDDQAIRKYQDYVQWHQLAKYQDLSDEIIIEFQDKMDWNKYSECGHISLKIGKMFKDKLNWDKISGDYWIDNDYDRNNDPRLTIYQDNNGYYHRIQLADLEYDEDFLREFQDVINWNTIVKEDQYLSPEFIREFKDRVNWDQISGYPYLYPNEEFNEEFIDEFKDYINWEIISYNNTLSEEFVLAHLDYIWLEELLDNEKVKLSDDVVKLINLLIETEQKKSTT